jgi:hypothetical protein
MRCQTALRMERLTQNEGFVKAISTAHPKQAKALIKTAKSNQLDIICEIILNVLKEVLAIPKAVFKKVKKHRKVIRRLAKKSLGKFLRRKLMVKYIGIVQSILAAVLPILSVAIGIAQF